MRSTAGTPLAAVVLACSWALSLAQTSGSDDCSQISPIWKTASLSAPSDCCSWSSSDSTNSIVCDSSGNITDLNLAGFFTVPNTAFPASITLLGNLARLDLSHNHLVGPIPPALNNLVNLQTLALNDNNFTGPIPDIAALTGLQRCTLPSSSCYDPSTQLPPSVCNVAPCSVALPLANHTATPSPTPSSSINSVVSSPASTQPDSSSGLSIAMIATIAGGVLCIILIIAIFIAIRRRSGALPRVSTLKRNDSNGFSKLNESSTNLTRPQSRADSKGSRKSVMSDEPSQYIDISPTAGPAIELQEQPSRSTDQVSIAIPSAASTASDAKNPTQPVRYQSSGNPFVIADFDEKETFGVTKDTGLLNWPVSFGDSTISAISKIAPDSESTGSKTKSDNDGDDAPVAAASADTTAPAALIAKDSQSDATSKGPAPPAPVALATTTVAGPPAAGSAVAADGSIPGAPLLMLDEPNRLEDRIDGGETDNKSPQLESLNEDSESETSSLSSSSIADVDDKHIQHRRVPARSTSIGFDSPRRASQPTKRASPAFRNMQQRFPRENSLRRLAIANSYVVSATSVNAAQAAGTNANSSTPQQQQQQAGISSPSFMDFNTINGQIEGAGSQEDGTLQSDSLYQWLEMYDYALRNLDSSYLECLSGYTFKIVHPHTRDLPDEIELQPGDLVTLDQPYLDGWGLGRNLTTHQSGMFPLRSIIPDHVEQDEIQFDESHPDVMSDNPFES